MKGVLFPYGQLPLGSDQVHGKLSHERPPRLLLAQWDTGKPVTSCESPHHKSIGIYDPRKEME